MEEESVHLITPAKSFVTSQKSPYRWVVLTIFSLLSLLQSAVWDTWGPISPSATEVMGFTDHDYYLLSNWAPIGIMSTMPLFIWLMNKYGTRIPVVIGSGLVAIGTGLRCLPVHQLPRVIVIHIGQFISAVAGCVVMGAAPLISNTWFPSNERILATSVMVCVGNTGNALSYLIGPAIVDPPNNCTSPKNSTPTDSTKFVQLDALNTTAHMSTTTHCMDNTVDMGKQIDYYLYGEFGFGVAVLLSAVLFFKNKPLIPPSSTAATERLDILDGLRRLSKNFSYWTSSVAFALVNGAYYGWYGVITVLLTPHHVSESDVAQAAFIMTMVGTAMGVAVGWFSDRIKGRIKWILFACYCAMFVSFLFLTLMVMGPMEFTHKGFLASFIVLGTFSNIIQPLGMEMAADIGYPVSEGPSTSVLAWLIMFSMFVFLLILNSLPSQDRDVANYLFLSFVGVAAPVLAFLTKKDGVRVGLDQSLTENRSAIQQDGNDISNDHSKPEV